MLSSTRRIFGGVLVLALVFAACGSSGTDTTAPDATSDAPATSLPAAPETTAGATTTTSAATVPINVFFAAGDGSDCSLVKPHERQVAADVDPIVAAFEELVGGPTAEEEANGAGSFFSGATSDAVLSATVVDGLLIVDFRDVRSDMNNASTSCGSASLLASLNATAFQFSEVDQVEYAIEGDCATFYNWLQTDCQRHSRQ